MQCDLSGPWYNFKEVEKKTGYVKNEILFKIESGVLPAVVHSTNRPFLAVSQSKCGQLIGHGYFRYSGPLAVSQCVINQLIRNEQALALAKPVKPLQLLNVEDWAKDIPYDGQCPNGFISAWEPLQYDELGHVNWSALIYPEEVDNYDFAESTLADRVPDHYDEDEYFERFAKDIIIESPSSPYFYATHAYSEFGLSDIRLPNVSVNTLLGIEPISEGVTRTAQKHVNELHAVIKRIINDYPDAKSGVLWQVLREDCDRDTRHYDHDELIERMDCHCIEWVSSNGIFKVMKKNSFQTSVSRLKKTEAA